MWGKVVSDDIELDIHWRGKKSNRFVARQRDDFCVAHLMITSQLFLAN